MAKSAEGSENEKVDYIQGTVESLGTDSDLWEKATVGDKNGTKPKFTVGNLIAESLSPTAHVYRVSGVVKRNEYEYWLTVHRYKSGINSFRKGIFVSGKTVYIYKKFLK